MAYRNFNLIEGSLYRTPLRLTEDWSEFEISPEQLEARKQLFLDEKRSRDLGYHHAERGKPPEPDNPNVKVRQAYIDGYKHARKDRLREDPHAATLGDISNGLGVEPGFYGHLHTKDPETSHEQLARAFSDHGAKLVEQIPSGKELWDSALAHKARSVDPALSPEEREAAAKNKREARNKVLMALTHKLQKIGLESIPEQERDARRTKFADDVMSRAFAGDRWDKLDEQTHGKVRGHVEAFFDAWGPVAESAVAGSMYPIHIIPHDKRSKVNYETRKVYTRPYVGDVFHELGHLVERYIASGNKRERFDISGEQSYWSNRVKARDSSPPKRLSEVTGLSLYEDDEVTKEDNWAEPYMGKVYPSMNFGVFQTGGSSEVLSVLTEAIGNPRKTTFPVQFERDPSILTEYAGFMSAVIAGEARLQSYQKIQEEEAAEFRRTSHVESVEPERNQSAIRRVARPQSKEAVLSVYLNEQIVEVPIRWASGYDTDAVIGVPPQLQEHWARATAFLKQRYAQGGLIAPYPALPIQVDSRYMDHSATAAFEIAKLVATRSPKWRVPPPYPAAEKLSPGEIA